MDPVIELDGLEVRFGDRAILKNLKAKLTGRSIGLLGPNGAGKSTLINTLLGFHKPSSGTARSPPPRSWRSLPGWPSTARCSSFPSSTSNFAERTCSRPGYCSSRRASEPSRREELPGASPTK